MFLFFPLFRDCTRVSLDDIVKKKALLDEGENPRTLKLALAQEITALYHGVDIAKSARRQWEEVFSQKKIPETIPEISVRNSTLLLDVLMEEKWCKSKAFARRLFDQGAVEFNQTVIKDVSFVLMRDGVLRVGKKILVRVRIR